MTARDMKNTLTLTVCIPTFGANGILDVAHQQLPQTDGVDYVVSWQNGIGDIPEELKQRSDIHIYRITGCGVSANRNNALRHAAGDIVLIADDDVDYRPEWLNNIRLRFAQHPRAKFILFQMQSLVPKQYPVKQPAEIVTRLPKGHYATSCELAVRREVFEHGIRFDERFGINSSKFTLGEDSLIVLNMMRQGFTGRYEPEIICFNHDTTSGQRSFKDPRQIASTGVLITWEHPRTALPRLVLKAIRMQRSHQGKFFTSILNLAKGAMWAYTHQPPWREHNS